MPGLDIGCLIHDQHRIADLVAGTQVPDRPVRCGPEHLLLIAAGARQQMLRPERTLVPDRPGDAPAVVILQLHQQTTNHVAAGEAVSRRAGHGAIRASRSCSKPACTS